MNEVATINPFASIAPARSSQQNAIAKTDEARAVAEVQAAMMIARANPRDQIAAMDRILNACTRPTLAEAAVYTYAKGGSNVSGPSIRLAEAMAQSWGNMQFGLRELSQSNGESTVQAYAWDVETNTRREITFQVPHLRHTRKGAYKLEDPREIYELVANQGSRRLRACILAVIPGDVTEAAVNQCEMTMHAKADTSPEAIQKLLAAFDGFGISKEQIETRIQRRVDAIQPAQIVSLRKIFASLKDGMSVPSEWFEVEPEEPKSTAVDVVKSKLGKGKATQTTDQNTGEIFDKDDDQIRQLEQETKAIAFGFDSVRISLESAKDADALAVAADLIGEISSADERDRLSKIYKTKSAEFKAQ